jgi:predicted component of type VI protein secretion system
VASDKVTLFSLIFSLFVEKIMAIRIRSITNIEGILIHIFNTYHKISQFAYDTYDIEGSESEK